MLYSKGNLNKWIIKWGEVAWVSSHIYVPCTRILCVFRVCNNYVEHFQQFEESISSIGIIVLWFCHKPPYPSHWFYHCDQCLPLSPPCHGWQFVITQPQPWAPMHESGLNVGFADGGFSSWMSSGSQTPDSNSVVKSMREGVKSYIVSYSNWISIVIIARVLTFH